jgi:SAM-dependent methyltransferase
MIDYFSLGHPLSKLRSHYALRARTKMFNLFMETFQPEAHHRVLDLGITPDDTLPESNFFEQLYPYRKNLTAASIEDAQNITQRFPGVNFVQISKGPLPFPDKHFDFVFCSAVLEHVGTQEDQRNFISETLRVSRHFMLTTPNRHFPMEFHTLIPFMHWLPQPLHQKFLRSIGKDFWAKTENLNLLTPGSMRALFPKCAELNIRSLHLFGFPSNIIAYGKT